MRRGVDVLLLKYYVMLLRCFEDIALTYYYLKQKRHFTLFLPVDFLLPLFCWTVGYFTNKYMIYPRNRYDKYYWWIKPFLYVIQVRLFDNINCFSCFPSCRHQKKLVFDLKHKWSLPVGVRGNITSKHRSDVLTRVSWQRNSKRWWTGTNNTSLGVSFEIYSRRYRNELIGRRN